MDIFCSLPEQEANIKLITNKYMPVLLFEITIRIIPPNQYTKLQQRGFQDECHIDGMIFCEEFFKNPFHKKIRNVLHVADPIFI
ncbi:hypothetical protein [Pedobacter sp. NJ-S-72]